MTRLNTKRPYGEIFGQCHGAAFSQKGLYFDSDGELIFNHPLYGPEEQKRVDILMAKEEASGGKPSAAIDDGEDDDDFFSGRPEDNDDDDDMPPPPKPKPGPKPPTSPPLKAGKTATPPPKLPGLPEAKTVEKVIGSGVDLKQWALGRKSYAFMAVRNEINRKYAFMATNKVSALNFLVDEGVIRESDLPKG